MDYEAIKKLITDGEALFAANPPGNNPEAIANIKTLASALLVASNNNGVIDQKCSTMVEFSEIAYAPRQRKGYSRQEALQIAEGDLERMRIHVRQHTQARKPPTTKNRDPGPTNRAQ